MLCDYFVVIEVYGSTLNNLGSYFTFSIFITFPVDISYITDSYVVIVETYISHVSQIQASKVIVF
jgi:hypothetical protein